MFNDKAADLFELANEFDKVPQKAPKGKRKSTKPKRARMERVDPMDDPEAYSAVYLFMGHGANGQNTGRPEGHASLLHSQERQDDFAKELAILEARKAKRRAKKNRRKNTRK